MQSYDDTHNVGDFVEAGLPNLKGDLNRALFGVDNKLFIDTYPIYKAIQDTPKNYTTAHNVRFDAHNYNPIYSDDINTVQPPAYIVCYIIKMS